LGFISKVYYFSGLRKLWKLCPSPQEFDVKVPSFKFKNLGMAKIKVKWDDVTL